MTNWKNTTIGKSQGGVGMDVDYAAKPVTSVLAYCRSELTKSGDFMREFKGLDPDTKAWFKAAAVEEIKANNVPNTLEN